MKKLKIRIKESEHPIGVKRSSNLQVPPEGHVYGLEGKKDQEGVGASKNKYISEI